jgi:hypothetical protein
MGSHTARYASLCAQWAQISGDEGYRERAIRALNWAGYMAEEDGTVTVGVDRPDYYNQCWFTDGYFDYVPHFIDSMAAIPSLAPADADHLLSSTTVIKRIEYLPGSVSYQTFHPAGSQTLRLSFVPIRVMDGKTPLAQFSQLGDKPGWCFDPQTGVLQVQHQLGQVEITSKE